MDDSPENRLHDLIIAAVRAGANAAEASVNRSDDTVVSVRLGKLETVARSEEEAWSLKVWIGARSASLASIDLGAAAGRDALIERALAMARLAPEDPFGGLAAAAIVRNATSGQAERALDLFDPTELSTAVLEGIAREAEAASLAIQGVANSDGGHATAGCSQRWHVTSEGFAGHQHRSIFGVFATAIADLDGSMETDGYGRNAIWHTDLPSPQSIGAQAGWRAVARLGARKLASTRAPVIFERRVSMRLLNPFLNAINGANVARGSSFLRHRLGQRVFASGVRILDDPLVVRGLGSRVADREGVPSQTRALIDDGILTTWMLNVASAMQLGLAPNGYASGFSNLTLQPGTSSLADLMTQAGSGLVVTDMFGPSLNAETGDWSAGVSGIWFEKGEAAFPVNGITVAGSLPDFYARLVVGSDLEMEGAANAPSLLIDAVTIAGS